MMFNQIFAQGPLWQSAPNANQLERPSGFRQNTLSSDKVLPHTPQPFNPATGSLALQGVIFAGLAA
jgi:hypothetical protein